MRLELFNDHLFSLAEQLETWTWSYVEAPDATEWLTNDIGIIKCFKHSENPTPYQTGFSDGRRHWMFPISCKYAIALCPLDQLWNFNAFPSFIHRMNGRLFGTPSISSTVAILPILFQLFGLETRRELLSNCPGFETHASVLKPAVTALCALPFARVDKIGGRTFIHQRPTTEETLNQLCLKFVTAHDSALINLQRAARHFTARP